MDIMRFVYFSFAIQVMLSFLLLVADAGPAALPETPGRALYADIMETMGTTYEEANEDASLDTDGLVRESQDSSVFDILGAIFDLAGMVLQFIVILIAFALNWVFLATYLDVSNAGGVIGKIMIFVWQWWTLYYMYKFVFTTTRVGNA